MASFASLPPEILVHIYKLSNEGRNASSRQRGRFSFGLISRACFLATADATDFYVAGEKQAKALLAQKLEAERKARSGRTTRSSLSITRVINIRRLSVVLDNKKSGKAVASLLRTTPNLIALDLNLSRVTQWIGDPTTAQLEPALGGLALLQEFKCQAIFMKPDQLLRILIPLKQLRVLDLGIGQYFSDGATSQNVFNRVALLHFRKVRMSLFNSPSAFPNALFGALASNSTAGVQVLDLTRTPFNYMKPAVTDQLIPHVANLVDLTWTPTASPVPVLDNLQTATRDALLALLGAMKGLQSIDISTWTHSQQSADDEPGTRLPIDTTLFDTLATLPSLHTVKVLVNAGKLAEDHVDRLISYIKSHRTLRTLSIRLEKPGTWTREQYASVEEASEEAGVAFAYTGSFV
ncbi:hypothetical protein RQP46_000158 [Phenoliferia psychrophenolica]